MVQELKVALRFMPSSKTLHLVLPHTGLAKSWKVSHPLHATIDDTLGCDTAASMGHVLLRGEP